LVQLRFQCSNPRQSRRQLRLHLTQQLVQRRILGS
jgi:hypothetical protein